MEEENEQECKRGEGEGKEKKYKERTALMLCTYTKNSHSMITDPNATAKNMKLLE